MTDRGKSFVKAPTLLPGIVRTVDSTATVCRWLRVLASRLLEVVPMIRALFTVAVASLIASPAFAADFKLTGENTKITFVGKKPDGKHAGGFKTVSGTAKVDGTDLTTLKLDATIDVNSIFSDDEKLTGHLKSPDFFDVKNHPKAMFKVTKVEKAEKGYTLTGELTMLGKTKPVVMPSTLSVAGDALTLKSDFKINRTDWGMTFGKGKIDEDVALKVEISIKK